MQLQDKLFELLPDGDFGVLRHGYMPYMRDYAVIVQLAGEGSASGVHRCIFTHCVLALVETRIHDSVWVVSWEDELIDYKTWQESGYPEGFVWGTNWSLAYPGLKCFPDSTDALTWSKRLGRQMHEITIETQAFLLRLVCHDV
ncbi:MAG: hypothetical protein IPK58_14445, partial [Acidobacteria bacterium]|nr:hypothetical protein [Acidobacteriota bacterium]